MVDPVAKQRICGYPLLIVRPVSYEEHPWDPRGLYASRGAIRRHSRPYRAAVPPEIAALDPISSLDSQAITDADEATQELRSFDEYVATKWSSPSREIAPMSSVLLRTESSSSSQIENLTVGARQLALFELGEATSANAGIVNSNVNSMKAALALDGPISTNGILEIHKRLLDGEDQDAGRLRDQQVWIGGSAVGPHSADFVPPHADRVPGLIDDLVAFCDRVDVPPLVQVAVAHAQFETIHPFTDGNGRTGRAIVQSMLKGTGVTGRTTVPVSSGLLVDTGRYFAALSRYREGELRPILEEFSRASRFAASEGRRLVDDLDAIRLRSAARIRARSDAAAWGLNDHLIAQPVVNTTYVATTLNISKVAAQTAIARLVESGILRESTRRVRYRVWQADEILLRLDDFAAEVKRLRP